MGRQVGDRIVRRGTPEARHPPRIPKVRPVRARPTVPVKPGYNAPVRGPRQRPATHSIKPGRPTYPGSGTTRPSVRDIPIVRAEFNQAKAQVNHLRKLEQIETGRTKPRSFASTVRVLTDPGYATREAYKYGFGLGRGRETNTGRVPTLFHAVDPGTARSIEQASSVLRRKVSGEAVPTGDLTDAILLLSPGGIPKRLGGTGLKMVGQRLIARGAKNVEGVIGGARVAREAARVLRTPELRAARATARQGAKVAREVERAALRTAPVSTRAAVRAGRLGRRAAPVARIGATPLTHPLRTGAVASLGAELPPGGSMKRALEGRGRLASFTAHDTVHGVLGLAPNAAADAFNLPAQTIPMIYLPAAALARGDGQALHDLWTSFRENDPAGALSRGDFGDFMRNLQAHPLYAGLELAGLYAGGGRLAGAGVRATTGGVRGQYGINWTTRIGTRIGVPQGLGRESVPRGASPNYVTSLFQRKIIDPRYRAAWEAGAGLRGFERPKSIGLLTWERAAALRRSANKYNVRLRESQRRGAVSKFDERVNELGYASDLGVATPAVGLAIRNLLRGGDRFTESARQMIAAGERALEARVRRPDGSTALLYPENLPGRTWIRENLTALHEVLKRPEYYREKIGLARQEYAKVYGTAERALLDQKVLFGEAADPFEAAIRARIKPSALTHGAREQGYYFREAPTAAERAATTARGEEPLPGGVVKNIPSTEARPVPPTEPGGPLAPVPEPPPAGGRPAQQRAVRALDEALAEKRGLTQPGRPTDVTTGDVRPDRPTMGFIHEGRVVTWQDGLTHGAKAQELGIPQDQITTFVVDTQGNAHGFFDMADAQALDAVGLNAIDTSTRPPAEAPPVPEADAPNVVLDDRSPDTAEAKVIVDEAGNVAVWEGFDAYDPHEFHGAVAERLQQDGSFGRLVAEGWWNKDEGLTDLYPSTDATSGRLASPPEYSAAVDATEQAGLSPNREILAQQWQHEDGALPGDHVWVRAARGENVPPETGGVPPWEPGKYGRGIVYKDGTVVTWADGSEVGVGQMITHQDYRRQTGSSFADESAQFEIQPDGRIVSTTGTQADVRLALDQNPNLKPENAAPEGPPINEQSAALPPNPYEGVTPGAARDVKRAQDMLDIMQSFADKGHPFDPEAVTYWQEQLRAAQAEAAGPRQLPPGGAGGQPPAVVPPSGGGGGLPPSGGTGGIPPLRQGVETVRVPTKELMDWSVETGGWRPDQGGAIPFHLSEAPIPPPNLAVRNRSMPGTISKQVTTGETAAALASPSGLRQITRTTQARFRLAERVRMYDRIVKDQENLAVNGTTARDAMEQAAALGYKPEAYYVVNRRALRQRKEAVKLLEDGQPEGYEIDNLSELYDRDSGWLDSAMRDPAQGAPEDQPGEWTIISREAGDEMLGHARGQDELDNTLAAFTYGFKSAVLPTSPKWLFANYFDTTLRSLINGLVPPPFGSIEGRYGLGRVGLARKIISASEHPADISSLESAIVPRGLTGSQSEAVGGFSKRDPQKYTRVAYSERDIASWLQAASALRKVKKIDDLAHAFHVYRHSIYKINGEVVEEPLFEGMIGKIASRSLKRHVEQWNKSLEANEAAIKSLAKGLDNDSGALQAFAREVNKQTGNWNLLSPKAKNIMLRYAPFYMWYRSATRFILLTMPINHPLLTGIIAAAANMTQNEREVLGLDLFAAAGAAGPNASWLAGGLPRKGGLMATSSQTSFGVFANYPETLSNAVLPQFTSLIQGFKGLRWTGDHLTDASGKDITDPRLIVAIAAGAELEAFLPWASLLTTAAAQGRQKLAPGLYRGKKTKGFWKALREAVTPTPLPGARVYHPLDQPGTGGGRTAAPAGGIGGAPTGGGGIGGPPGGGGGPQ